MSQGIVLPGGVEFKEPSPEMQVLAAIHEQLRQVTLTLNTLAGQLDTGLRLASGFYSKHEIKTRFQDFDAKMRAAQGVAQESNTNKEGDVNEG